MNLRTSKGGIKSVPWTISTTIECGVLRSKVCSGTFWQVSRWDMLLNRWRGINGSLCMNWRRLMVLIQRVLITSLIEGTLSETLWSNFSVEIYRNNRAAIPRYTLSEAAKLKNPHGATAATYASSGLVQMRKYTPGVAYNAIFLEGVKGTVLQADLQTALNPLLNSSKLVFSVKVPQPLGTILTFSGSIMVKTCYFFRVLHRCLSKTSRPPFTAWWNQSNNTSRRQG